MATMKSWQYNDVSGGLEKNLHLVEDAPKPQIESENQVLVEVLSVAINPADYKIPELGALSKAMIARPATPGHDFCGRVVETGAAVRRVQKDQLVWGFLKAPCRYGALSQFIVIPDEICVALPSNVSPDEGACIGAAGVTAYQSIAQNTKAGDSIFINGGSGGCGTFGIQIGKALGLHVTTSCSTPNVELCKRLGADEVLDYRSVDIVEELKAKGRMFSVIVDNVGSLSNLYKSSSAYLLPTGKFEQVGNNMDWGSTKNFFGNLLTPSFLGGGQAKYRYFIMDQSAVQDFEKLGEMAGQKKIIPVIDSTFEFEDTPKAYIKLKTGRAKGKIIIRVKSE